MRPKKKKKRQILKHLQKYMGRETPLTLTTTNTLLFNTLMKFGPKVGSNEAGTPPSFHIYLIIMIHFFIYIIFNVA